MGPDLDLVRAALPGYEIGAEIGRGGWGVVLQGEHRALGRRAAIKQLPQAFEADVKARERFVEEARIVSSMDHPHIVPVYDFVDHEGLGLIVMELLEGGTLWARFTSAGVRADAACAITLAVCSALEATHSVGVLHRDLKPENVLFNRRGVPKLSDFGVAKVLGATNRRTVVGEILGTPAYMSPEQALGQALGPATDLYSVGVMLYELLAGCLPFRDKDPVALLLKHASAEPEPISQVAAGIPQPIADVVMQALRKDPADRPPSAEAFGVRLAMAASRSYGADWLHESGIPLLGGGPIVDAAHKAPGTPAPTSRPTVRRSRSEGHHPRIGDVVADASGGGTGGNAGALTRHGVGRSAGTLPPRPAPVEGSAPPSGTTSGAVEPPPPVDATQSAPARGSRVRLLVAAAAVLVVGVAAAILLLDRGRGSSAGFLANTSGFTLYVTDQDPPGASNCNLPCSDTWPPVVTVGEVADIARSRLTEITRADGTKQVAIEGRPLYRYIKDQKPGDAKGHGTSRVWFAVNKSGQPIAVRIGSTDSGDVLVDPDGFTVYVFRKDTPGRATCTGECARKWRGVPDDALIDRSLDKTEFGTVARNDSGTQLAWKDRALYRSTDDKDPGDTNGTVEATGDWEVVPARELARSSPAPG